MIPQRFGILGFLVALIRGCQVSPPFHHQSKPYSRSAECKVERWDTMEELAEAVRVVAAGKKMADISQDFHRAGADPTRRVELYCSDKVHLGAAGHRLTAEVAQEAITASG